MMPSQLLIDRMRALRRHEGRRCDRRACARPVEADGIEQVCENCIYFLARRRWCDLPELNIPVDPEWYCELWRV